MGYINVEETHRVTRPIRRDASKTTTFPHEDDMSPPRWIEVLVLKHFDYQGTVKKPGDLMVIEHRHLVELLAGGLVALDSAESEPMQQVTLEGEGHIAELFRHFVRLGIWSEFDAREKLLYARYIPAKDLVVFRDGTYMRVEELREQLERAEELDQMPERWDKARARRV